MGVLKSGLFFLFIGLLPILLNFVLCPVYPIHTSGAILVTGASTGIGKHIATTLANKGYTVLAGVRSQKDFDGLQNFHNNIVPVILDVTKSDSIHGAFERVNGILAQQKISLVGLVNNAGVNTVGPTELVDIKEVRNVFNVNVFGLVEVSQKFLPLIRSSHGRVVNIGSISGRLSSPFQGAYSGSKFALEAITDAMRVELSSVGVSVSLIEPGAVHSDIWDKNSVDVFEPQRKEWSKVYPELSELALKVAPKLMSFREGPESTSEAVVRAFTDARPSTRYLTSNMMGIPTWILSLLVRFLPDRVLDVLSVSV